MQRGAAVNEVKPDRPGTRYNGFNLEETDIYALLGAL